MAFDERIAKNHLTPNREIHRGRRKLEKVLESLYAFGGSGGFSSDGWPP